jgi:hypothetical protein
VIFICCSTDISIIYSVVNASGSSPGTGSTRTRPLLADDQLAFSEILGRKKKFFVLFLFIFITLFLIPLE